MESGNKKLLQILRAARDLFWKHGMKRVTVEEICLSAGVSKMTFYKHFNNKQELALLILRQLFDASMLEYRKVMDSNLSYPEKVNRIISNKLHYAKDASQELIRELYGEGEPEIMDFIQQQIQATFAMIREEFRVLQMNGEIRPDMKPDFLLYILNKMVEMVSDAEFEALFSSPSEMTGTLSGFFFYGILPQDNRRSE